MSAASPSSSAHPEPMAPADRAVDLGAAGGSTASAFDEPADRDLRDIAAVEVISRAVVMLMSAAAEQLGLGDADPLTAAHQDFDEARTLITALAGLVNASAPDLGPHAAAFRDGLSALQAAFREYSPVPDLPRRGPGEGPRVPHD